MRRLNGDVSGCAKDEWRAAMASRGSKRFEELAVCVCVAAQRWCVVGLVVRSQEAAVQWMDGFSKGRDDGLQRARGRLRQSRAGSGDAVVVRKQLEKTATAWRRLKSGWLDLARGESEARRMGWDAMRKTRASR